MGNVAYCTCSESGQYRELRRLAQLTFHHCITALGRHGLISTFAAHYLCRVSTCTQWQGGTIQ